MNAPMETVFGLAGGLAVFLFGMNMMSEGLQKAAGAKMKSILSMLTSNPVLGVLDRFLWLQFDELRILPDFGSGQPTVEDRVSCRVSAQALFIVLAAVRVLYEFWRKKVLDIFL